jgi:cell division protein FtsA
MLEKLSKIKDGVKSKVKKSPKQAADRYVVALDIGTENVKALIGQIHGNNVDIIGVGKAHQGLSDMQAGAVADIAAVTSNCNTALSRAEEQAGVSARAVVIGIAGELVKGTTISVRISRKDGKKPLDVDEVETIISLVQKRAFEKARKKIAAELGGKEIDIQLVNSALVRMEIDGYVVTNPVGFQGKEVTVQLYTAFAPLIHIGALEQVAQQLDMDLLAVAAEPFAVARSVVGDDSESTMSAVLMDVGGGTTDIAVLSEGGVQGTEMFGIGGRAFTRSIERDMGVTFDEAESLKLTLSKGATPAAKKKSVEKALNKTVKVWRSGVEMALEEFGSLDHLPHHIYLCGGGASLEMLVDELEQSNWYTDLPFAKKPSVQYISPDAAVGIIDTTQKLADHTFITAMGLLRVAIDTIDQSGDEEDDSISVRDRINRILKI